MQLRTSYGVQDFRIFRSVSHLLLGDFLVTMSGAFASALALFRPTSLLRVNRNAIVWIKDLLSNYAKGLYPRSEDIKPYSRPDPL